MMTKWRINVSEFAMSSLHIFHLLIFNQTVCSTNYQRATVQPYKDDPRGERYIDYLHLKIHLKDNKLIIRLRKYFFFMHATVTKQLLKNSLHKDSLIGFYVKIYFFKTGCVYHGTV